MTTTKDYNAEAQAVATKLGLTVTIARDPRNLCPTWGRKANKSCEHDAHGAHYRVTLSKFTETPIHGARVSHIDGRAARSIAFDFWDSRAHLEAGTPLDLYSVLASVGSDLHTPTDPDAVVEEFGEMKPSQAIAIAQWAVKLQAFFPGDYERTLLAEIQ